MSTTFFGCHLVKTFDMFVIDSKLFLANLPKMTTDRTALLV